MDGFRIAASCHKAPGYDAGVRTQLAILALTVAGCGAGGVRAIRDRAPALRPLVTTPLAQRYLDAAARLPPVPTRVVHAAGASKVVDEEYYYTTRYGTPLAYVRPLELLARAGFADVRGRRILDFGYGGIGQLLMLAALGADVVGVDVDPLLRAMYAERDGAFGDGRVHTVEGRWPADATVRAGVAGRYDLIVSKNVLKRGYIHPSQPADERKLIKLGVGDEAFVRSAYDALVPGGRFLIYNLAPAPAPAGKPYIPWADGRSPFPRELFERVGFRVVAFEVDDTAAARAMAHVLGWDRGTEAMNLTNDLFAQYTLVERP
jgi:SAM-dependent methyltransferase